MVGVLVLLKVKEVVFVQSGSTVAEGVGVQVSVQVFVRVGVEVAVHVSVSVAVLVSTAEAQVKTLAQNVINTPKTFALIFSPFRDA